MVWYDFVNYSLILFCILVIVLKYRLLPNEIRLFLFYFILTLLLEAVTAYYIIKLQRKNNLFLYHIFVPFQYAILGLYFLNLYGQNKNKKILFALAMSVLIMLII